MWTSAGPSLGQGSLSSEGTPGLRGRGKETQPQVWGTPHCWAATWGERAERRSGTRETEREIHGRSGPSGHLPGGRRRRRAGPSEEVLGPAGPERAEEGGCLSVFSFLALASGGIRGAGREDDGAAGG